MLKSDQTTHFGTIRFESGDITVKEGKLQSGKFVADINTLENIDLKDNQEDVYKRQPFYYFISIFIFLEKSFLQRIVNSDEKISVDKFHNFYLLFADIISAIFCKNKDKKLINNYCITC